MVNKSLKDGVVDVKRQGDRMILVKLVVGDLVLNVISAIRVQRGKRAKVARTKWWKLKGEASQTFRERVIKEGPWEEGGDANMMWTSMATCLQKVDVEEFGVTKGSRREAKDTWWWNDEVQKVIREKNDCFRCLYLDRSAANMEKYKVAKKAAKRAVSEARDRAYEDLYQRLNTKEGERDIYKMAKFRERNTRDVNEVKCIKDGDDQLLVKDEAIKRRWREYFDNLYNGEVESSTIELDDSFDDTIMCFVRRIQESGVKEALRRMKGGKAMGPDGRQDAGEKEVQNWCPDGFRRNGGKGSLLFLNTSQPAALMTNARGQRTAPHLAILPAFPKREEHGLDKYDSPSQASGWLL
ncbi:uncharacterized protein [Lolium perenne]|uniref:uncharacterized protein n=1 Tax=Lolium perenne TaxID=4522 RepID=UPI0021F5606D|nr:uncharacterized protein LOC127338675 [Lolium perenne]